MPGKPIREQIMEALLIVLSNIQQGIIVEGTGMLPDPFFIVMDNFDTQDDIDGWTPSGAAAAPTLNTTTVLKPPGAMNLIKLATSGDCAVVEKTFAVGFDATNKGASIQFYTTDSLKLHINNAFKIRIGSDSSNYYEGTFARANLNDDQWTPLSIDIDGILGNAPVIVGNPDFTNITYLYLCIRTTTAIIQILEGEVIVDFWALVDPSTWIPSGGSDAPFVNEKEELAVIGIYCIGFGHLANTDPVFALSKFIGPFDLTGGEVEVWVYIQDKTKYNDNFPSGFTVGILIGTDSANWYGRFLTRSEITDVVNDLSSGWNQIKFDPVTESDLIANSPDIANIGFVSIGGVALTSATEIPAGDVNLDFFRFTGTDGDYNNDVKEVYRYAIGVQQTAGSPSIMFVALAENVESKLWPISYNTLTIGMDAEVVLPDEVELDKALTLLDADIQVALMGNQTLFELARYVEIKRREFSVREGTHTGILSLTVEVQYAVNQLDPTKQGL